MSEAGANLSGTGIFGGIMKSVFSYFTYGCRCAPPGWQRRNYPGIHRFYLVLGGTGWYTEAGVRHPFVRNRFYLFPQNGVFETGQDEGDPLFHLYFDFTVLPPVRTMSVQTLDAEEDRACRTLAQALCALLDAPEENREAVEAVFPVLFERFCTLRSLERMTDPRLAEVLQILHTQYAGPVTVRDVAVQVHMDPDHLIRVFRGAMGLTPHRYLLRYRLHRAADLLASGVPVARAAEQTGFSEPSSLCHAMRREMGVNPSAFRPEK